MYFHESVRNLHFKYKLGSEAALQGWPKDADTVMLPAEKQVSTGLCLLAHYVGHMSAQKGSLTGPRYPLFPYPHPQNFTKLQKTVLEKTSKDFFSKARATMQFLTGVSAIH